MDIVDFTNPVARQWYGDKLRALLDMGAGCFKSDFGERIPTDVVYWDGSDPAKMHNYYSYLYNKTVLDVLRERRGEGEAVLFSRSADHLFTSLCSDTHCGSRPSSDKIGVHSLLVRP